MLGCGAALIPCLVKLPWYEVALAGPSDQLGLTVTAIQAPDGGHGVIALLVTVLLVGQIVAARLLGLRLPQPPLAWWTIQYVGAAVVLGLLLLKLTDQMHFLGIGAYACPALAAGMVYGGFLIHREGRSLA